MKNTKLKTAVKKTTKTTKPCNEIGLIHERIDNTIHSLNYTDESICFLAERQQVMFYAIAVATLLGAVNFIWLCLK
jgi:hypothetical protein